jgi:hypothetical protein
LKKLVVEKSERKREISKLAICPKPPKRGKRRDERYLSLLKKKQEAKKARRDVPAQQTKK